MHITLFGDRILPIKVASYCLDAIDKKVVVKTDFNLLS